MRQRITFLHAVGGAVDPAALKITDESLAGPEIDAAREVRVTLALEELPDELASVLKKAHELHLRWVAPDASEAVSPLHARLPPGLHLFYTPLRPDDLQSDSLCALLLKAFPSLDCISPNDSFVSLPNDRFSHSAALQFYQPLDDVASAFQYVRDVLCPGPDALCRAQVDRATDAVSLDLDYDTISHSLRVTALSPRQTQPLAATARPGGHRVEVGILGEDAPPTLEAHELGISGHLVVLGQQKTPSPTMFGFPSRHRRHVGSGTGPRSTVSVSFVEPTGLHPTLALRLSSDQPPPGEAHCAPHAYFTFPRSIFADKYQLSDALLLESKNLSALRYISSPVDLEAPEYAVNLWGSSALVELAPPQPRSQGSSDDAPSEDQAWTAAIPLHLRYLVPAKGGHGSIDIPYPAVFWACTAEEGTKFPTNPFDRVNLGYDGLFGPRTVFWHVTPEPEVGTRLLNRIDVPVLDLDKAGWVSTGTAAVVLLGFAWVVWRLAAVVLSPAGDASKVSPAKKSSERKKIQ